LEPEKKDVYEENHNIYKNNLDFNEDDYEVDAETIVINDDNEPVKKDESVSAQSKQEKEEPKKQEDSSSEKDETTEKKPMKKVSKPIKPVTKNKKPKKTKKVRKKTSKSRPAKPKKSKTEENSVWPWVVLIIVIIAATAVLIWSIVRQPSITGSVIGDDITSQTVVATVNGQEITLGEINTRYQSLNPFYRSIITKEMLLNQSIDELLLLQKAEEMGITASSELVDETLNNILQENNLSYEDFVSRIESQGLTMDYVKSVYKNQIIIEEVLNQTVFSGISVTDEEMQQYYDEKKDSFVTSPEQVKVRHILVNINDSRTKEEAEELINQVKTEYMQGEDFCTLVEEYSDDPGSIANCGEYTFARGQMVPEFEQASFDLDPNQTEIVQSLYGYHFIEKLENIPAVQASFNELKDKIKESLIYTKQEEKYADYIGQLRSQAEITKNPELLNTEVTQEETSTTGNAVADIKIDDPQTTTNQDSVQENQNEESGLADETNQDQQDQTMTEQKDVQISETQQTSQDQDVSDISECLQATDAKLYGAYWKKEVKDQKDLLGDNINLITYVECDANQPNGQPEKCQKEGIVNYPTWIIDGKKYEGKKTLEELKELALC